MKKFICFLVLSLTFLSACSEIGLDGNDNTMFQEHKALIVPVDGLTSIFVRVINDNQTYLFHVPSTLVKKLLPEGAVIAFGEAYPAFLKANTDGDYRVCIPGGKSNGSIHLVTGDDLPFDKVNFTCPDIGIDPFSFASDWEPALIQPGDLQLVKSLKASIDEGIVQFYVNEPNFRDSSAFVSTGKGVVWILKENCDPNYISFTTIVKIDDNDLFSNELSRQQLREFLGGNVREFSVVMGCTTKAPQFR